MQIRQNKIYYHIIFYILLFLYACSPSQLQYTKNGKIPLHSLLNHLPAKDSVECILIFNAILDYGDKRVTEICRQLDSDDEKVQVQSKWALNGLAVYVSGSHKDHLRKIYNSGLSRALDLSLSAESKSFIINQFQITGSDEAVSKLASYINDPILYESAIKTLSTIGGESAGEALLKTLQSANQKQKVTLIQSLGMMQYEPASEMIMSLINDSNESVQQASRFTLSNIGYSPAKIALQPLSEKDDKFKIYYLRFAEKMGEKGDVESCLKICDEILKNDKNIYSTNNRIEALNIWINYNPGEDRERLIKILSEDNKKLQLTTLQFLRESDLSESIPQLIHLAEDKDPDVQSRIIEILGEQQSKDIVLFLKKSLNSPFPEVRMAALKVLSGKKQSDFLSDLQKVLQDSLGEYESKQVELILLTSLDSMAIDALMDHYDDLSVQSKILLLRVLSEKNKLSHIPHFLSSLDSSDPDLRLTAIKGLERCREDSLKDSIIERLVFFFIKSADEKEKTAALRTIALLINRSASKNNQISSLIDRYHNSTMDEKILLLRIFQAVGGKEMMEITIEQLESKDRQIHEAAVYSLAEWTDASVLDRLIDIGKNNQNERLRIIVLRGALRLLKDSPMGEQRALYYYQDILGAVTKPEEKRLILAGLAEIKTASSLSLIASMLDSSEINQEAFLAALAVSSKSEENNENLSRDEIVTALIESQSNAALKEKIKNYIQDHITKPHPPEGFRSLFNGKNLDGWRGLVLDPVQRAQMSKDELDEAQNEADKIMNEHWQVVDGLLFFDGKGSHLCTLEEFSDFEMFIDWKIEKNGDSGIYLRGSPQVQIWDTARGPEGSGGLYNNKLHPNKPLQKADHPIGDWNTFHIIMRGKKVTVYLNNVLVVDRVVMENYWERDQPIYHTGQIELQSHNTPLYFKNIFIRDLDPLKPMIDGDLFNGKDFSGWQIIDNSPDSWQVSDSILYTDGEGGGWISTVEEFVDFELSLEFRVAEGGNSGIFLRAPHQGDPAYTGIEIQILDDYADIYSDLKEWQYTGSIYGLHAPSKRASKTSGEWQKMKIICDGPGIKISLNGEGIIEANLIDYMYKEEEHPGIKRRKGYIGLQNHNTKIEFRNITIRELNK